ncbi:hypothetical protein [Moorena producens]|uniref:hypothetical protein n=1 Tax=Moorena producens TaxID=1155739 RepID=UPI003C765E22
MGNRESGIGNRESEPTPNPSQEGNGSRESGIGSWEINRRVGSGCCLKLASSREALDQPLPTRQELFLLSVSCMTRCDRFHFQMGRWGGIVGWAVAVA